MTDYLDSGSGGGDGDYGCDGDGDSQGGEGPQCQYGTSADGTCASAPEPPAPTCEQTEAAYLTQYLSKPQYAGNPLIPYLSEIVKLSDAAGLDDRFILALAGTESGYGRYQNPAGSGQYNIFSNGAHCAALNVNKYCVDVDPYGSYDAAISDVIATIGSSALYAGKNSTLAIYSLYETGNPDKVSARQGLLDQIYGNQLHGDTNNVRKPRCP